MLGELLTLLGFDITIPDGYWQHRFETGGCAVDSRHSTAPRTPEFLHFHYVRPRRMLALHRRGHSSATMIM
jgi:hypothetical protein